MLIYCVSDRCMMDSDDEVRDRATFYMNCPSAEAEGLECRLHLQWWGFVFKCWLQLFWIVKILLCIWYRIWFISWCEWTRVIEWFVHRSVRICSRTGEIPPPVHTGALWETVRHEDSSLGHRTHHRTENRCEPELQQANNFITHHNPLHNIFIVTYAQFFFVYILP